VTAFLTSPHLIDLILGFTLVEAIVIVALRILPPLVIARTLLPGAGVMLALRAALAQSAWPWVPLALAFALVAHLFDLAGRRRR